MEGERERAGMQEERKADEACVESGNWNQTAP